MLENPLKNLNIVLVVNTWQKTFFDWIKLNYIKGKFKIYFALVLCFAFDLPSNESGYLFWWGGNSYKLVVFEFYIFYDQIWKFHIFQKIYSSKFL